MSSDGGGTASILALMIAETRLRQMFEEWCDPADCRAGIELCPGGDPIVRWAHLRQLGLCDELERIADSLPAAVDKIRCLAVANTLVPLLRDIHRYEEQAVFPVFQSMEGCAELRAATIQRLCAEHLEDECFADEVTEALLAIGHGHPVGNAEAIGFMLRGLFETMRRHVAFEREHVMPLLDPQRCKRLS
jgi:hypothetical protein